MRVTSEENKGESDASQTSPVPQQSEAAATDVAPSPPAAKPLEAQDPAPSAPAIAPGGSGAALVQPDPNRELEYLWDKPGKLRESFFGVPSALAAIAALVAAGVAMQVHLFPLIPLIALGVLCIANWNYHWARSIWYATLVSYALWLAAVTLGVWFPFFLALIFAYVTSPVVGATARLVRSRLVATLIFFAVLLSVLVLFNWFAYAELSSTIQHVRKQVESPEALHENVHRLLSPFGEQFEVPAEQIEEFTETTTQTITSGLNRAKELFSEESIEGLIGWASATLDTIGALLLNFLLFLVAAFYLLLDWPRLSGKVDSYFSPQRGQRLAKLSDDIGRILRQYVQGHSVVCLLVGLIFYVLLTLFGHPHALLLGLVMGILGLIPFLGPIVAGLVALAVTLTVTSDTGYYLVAVVICYAAAQALNDFVLYPNIAGRSVEVNPVVALLVLFLIGYGFGILGMFFAVPLVAIARVVIRWINEENLAGFEWLKLFRPYEIRHEQTLKKQREQLRQLRESQRAAAVPATESTPDASH